MFASAITETGGENRAKETASAVPPLQTTTQVQRLVQMYQLAEIFAAIFDTLPGEPANSTVEKAA